MTTSFVEQWVVLLGRRRGDEETLAQNHAGYTSVLSYTELVSSESSPASVLSTALAYSRALKQVPSWAYRNFAYGFLYRSLNRSVLGVEAAYVAILEKMEVKKPSFLVAEAAIRLTEVLERFPGLFLLGDVLEREAARVSTREFVPWLDRLSSELQRYPAFCRDGLDKLLPRREDSRPASRPLAGNQLPPSFEHVMHEVPSPPRLRRSRHYRTPPRGSAWPLPPARRPVLLTAPPERVAALGRIKIEGCDNDDDEPTTKRPRLQE